MDPDLGIRKADSTKIQSLIGGDDDGDYYQNPYGMMGQNPMMGMGMGMGGLGPQIP